MVYFDTNIKNYMNHRVEFSLYLYTQNVSVTRSSLDDEFDSSMLWLQQEQVQQANRSIRVLFLRLNV